LPTLAGLRLPLLGYEVQILGRVILAPSMTLNEFVSRDHLPLVPASLALPLPPWYVGSAHALARAFPVLTLGWCVGQARNRPLTCVRPLHTHTRTHTLLPYTYLLCIATDVGLHISFVVLRLPPSITQDKCVITLQRTSFHSQVDGRVDEIGHADTRKTMADSRSEN
jgi:hypothetical protein